MRAANLKRIDLYRNNIGANGCSDLVKAKWPKLSTIDLSNYALIKKEIKLETLAASG